MANTPDGIAILDLVGNRVEWYPGHQNHDWILLEGYHFHNVVLMVTLVISGLCALSFLTILVSLCVVCCGRNNTSKYLPWATVWIPILSMIGFFVLDITNRVFHELQSVERVEYVAIDVPMGSLASIADAVLMTYLTKHSPVKPNRRTAFAAWLIMYLAILVFSLSSFASKGTQIWGLIEVIGGGGSTENISGPSDVQHLSDAVNAFRKLTSATAGILLGFSIGFLILAILHIRPRNGAQELSKRLSWSVGALAGCFVARSAVNFVFWLLYSQFGHTASYGVQLVYMVFYGPLSVTVYMCIVLTAAAQGKQESLEPPRGYGEVNQTEVEDRYGWSPQKQYSYVHAMPAPKQSADLSNWQDQGQQWN